MEKFKPFWVVTVNNYICDASYSGKEIKEKHVFPSFRKFIFIKDLDQINYFAKRDEISNKQTVEQCLGVEI